MEWVSRHVVEMELGIRRSEWSTKDWGIGIRLGTYNKDECSNGEVCVDECLLEDDLEWSVLCRPCIRPVLAALDTRALNQVRYHDNGRGTSLPD